MTRKHFNAIAKAMTQLRKFDVEDRELSSENVRVVRYSSVVDALAGICAANNENFDRDRFLTACGISVEESKLKAAREAIERKDVVCFDVCAEHGQIFGNVKHTTWFLEAVAEAL